MIPPVSVWAVLKDSGPRLVLNSLGPVAAFYVGYRLFGLPAGVGLAAAVGVCLYVWERRHGRPGLIPRLALGFIAIQAVVGFISGSATIYFMQPVLVDVALAAGFAGSAAVGRSLVGAAARDAYPFPDVVVESATFRRVFSRLAWLWGAYFITRAGVRLLGVRTGDVDTIVLINIASGFPFVIALLGFNVWYSVHAFRTSGEWGPLIRMAEEPPVTQ